MTFLPILKFSPMLKSIVWGGRKMETLLNRTLPSIEPYGESWELCDLDGNQSEVVGGEYSGWTLEKLISSAPDALLGTAKLLEGRFPLLFKFIDAQQTLSVQVHPDATACKILQQGARPKTEAWYIIDAIEGAKLYVGLKKGVSRAQFEQALSDGSVSSLLYERQVSKGDYIFLPSGTVHAIGEGIVLAEVQQSSNTTYRVFDWNRVGLDGNPRPLHVSEALASIHFNSFEQPEITPPVSGRPGVLCAYFSMETATLYPAHPIIFSHSGPIVCMVTEGDGIVTIAADKETEICKKGETIVVPACLAANVRFEADSSMACVITQVL